jgi:predicted helicase
VAGGIVAAIRGNRMSQLLVNQFLNDLDRTRKISGSLNEQTIREAFKDLLKNWSRQQNLHFIAELDYTTPLKTTVYPDGTILHDLRVPLGYWEAKDTKDDLDEEIRKKFLKGYPQDNIIFENSETAVLIQNRNEVMRCSMLDTGELLRLVTLFFGYEREEIRDFRKAVEQFKHDIPAVLKALREKIDAAYSGNPDFKTAADKFLAHAKDTINPAIVEADIREMLIQHILTEEIFAHVFDQGDFHRDNNIAKELYALEAKFFTGQLKRETLKGLETYYSTIRSNAALITSHAEKQTFLKVIYENFYKVYNPKAADRLGVVYTPNEIVKFMIEGADWLCQKHFNKSLIDRDVEILDPATGTGTFICELIEHFRGQPGKLAHKYKNELHANEVAILPYYVANLNIEATYAAVSGQYAEFPNLCFVDTLDNVAGLGIRAGYQADMFAGLSEENIERVKRQNKRKISVIIGNPPYNAWQENFNMRNPNRAYRRIDQRIKDTYIRKGTAQNKNSVYDMYTRFFRWASDRLHDDGVLVFISNRNFIDKAAFDGFRRDVGDEFNEIFVVDLGGDVRANPKLSGTKNNVFGIQTGVTVTFLVKRSKQKGSRIFYVRRPEMETAEDKLAWLSSSKASDIRYERIEPDKSAAWVDQVESSWDEFAPLVDPTAKKPSAIGGSFSLGLEPKTREWLHDASLEVVLQKAQLFIDRYNTAVDSSDYPNDEIKWHRELAKHAKAGRKANFDESRISKIAFRPFKEFWFYFDPLLISQNFRQQNYFPPEQKNHGFVFLGRGANKPFSTLAVGAVPEHDFIEKSQFFPRFRYTKSGERVDNITDWGLKAFEARYGGGAVLLRSFGASQDGVLDSATAKTTMRTNATVQNKARPSDPAKLEERSRTAPPRSGARSITKDAIFHYVYAVLHDPIYREKYALNLKREFPRIPFYPDFWEWAAWGEKLMASHIGYERAEPWPLERLDTPDLRARAAGVAPKAMLKADKEGGIIRLDSETQLSGIPRQAWEYRLGNRSGLEWILDQYKEKTPKDPTIREKFNTYRFADYKEKVIDLIMRVTRVSVETVAVTEAMRGA